MKVLYWIGAVITAATVVVVFSDPTKEDLLKRAEGINKRQRLQQVLGTPDKVSTAGAKETWTYDAANGTVSFVLAGDFVTVSAAGEKNDNDV